MIVSGVCMCLHVIMPTSMPWMLDGGHTSTLHVYVSPLCHGVKGGIFCRNVYVLGVLELDSVGSF